LINANRNIAAQSLVKIFLIHWVIRRWTSLFASILTLRPFSLR
jgi:hypothetical protein